MAKMKKWQIATIVIALIVVLVGMTGLMVWLFLFRNQGSESGKYIELSGYTRLEWNIGTNAYDGKDKINTMSVSALFGAEPSEKVTYASGDNTIATIDGDKITMTGKLGDLTLIATTDGVAVEHKAKVIDGVNAFKYEDLLYATLQKHVPIMQNDIDALDPAKMEGLLLTQDDRTLNLYTDMYGNGHRLDGNKINAGVKKNYYFVQVRVYGQDVTIQDVYFRGLEPPKEETSLSFYGAGGMLVAFSGDKENRPSGSVVNCMLENAQRPIFIKTADVEIKGCLIRNAADAGISIQTSPDGTSNVTLESNAIADSMVAGVLVWCYEKITNPNDYVNLNIKGFLDIYNWKDSEMCQLVPNSEAVAGLVNPMIRDEMKKSEYKKFFYARGGKKYIHSGIIVIATGGAKANKPKITGLDEIGYNKRDFPMPGLASKFMSMCEVYGYEKKPSIAPGMTMGDNPNLFPELVSGKKVEKK